MITDVEGVEVGHWTDPVARTGCTVVLFPPGTVASGEVRGGAPATRECALLAPERLVNRIDAVVLSGGSAFGLAAADGVMRWLEASGRGFPTGAGPVPIVVGLSLFDLLVGDPSVRPGPEEGYAACEQARSGAIEVGAVGAGTGVTTGTWRGRDHARPGGLVTATVREGEVVVSALLAVNAFGEVDDGTLSTRLDDRFADVGEGSFGNTVIGVVATNAALDKHACSVAASGAQDGIARAVFPPHTRVDGDAVVVAATGAVAASTELIRTLAVLAVERAIRTLA